ncbi:cation acetate symporter [Arthrobacter sp. OY3WO11]|uniref:sodium/solute symporter n=1 Tax=Arthrobacter sp. OY3WO11 TaxID=1835723 RepID=UPI0007CFF1E2|nr:cation acetate symporter [Arthrobacter sp. OY3WO11]OAD97753.1 cation acetate symporter [Arthrobacter sp. OY3WO11]
MNNVAGLLGLLVILALTILIGVYSRKFSRTTSDFYVASRAARPWWNASAIGGEYLASASYLGVAGLIAVAGRNALLIPLGYTAGFLLLLMFVAAPLRRSNAYTLPDFAQARFGSLAVRRVTAIVSIMICGTYVVPQLHGAALTVEVAAGLPPWTGSAAVAAVVCLTVVTGGMRSITFVQAIQFWFKVAAMAFPLAFMAFALMGRENGLAAVSMAFERLPGDSAEASPYRTVSLLMALILGTIGLPHVLARFYTSPDGGSARRTGTIVPCLVAGFYLLPMSYGVLGRAFMPAVRQGEADALVLLLPDLLLDGVPGAALSAVVAAGAFSAFLATTSGLIVALAAVVSQEFFHSDVAGFQWAAIISSASTLAVSLFTSSVSLVETVALIFAFSAATIVPMLILGIWWPRLTPSGAAAGMISGGSLVVTALVIHTIMGSTAGPVSDLLAQPAAWAVPTSFAIMIAVSLTSKPTNPARVERFMRQIHRPDFELPAKSHRKRDNTWT